LTIDIFSYKIVWSTSHSTMLLTNTQLTRYRVTIDFTVDDTNCVHPRDWNWKELIQLKGDEKVRELYVENLGTYNTKKGKRKEKKNG